MSITQLAQADVAATISTKEDGLERAKEIISSGLKSFSLPDLVKPYCFNDYIVLGFFVGDYDDPLLSYNPLQATIKIVKHYNLNTLSRFIKFRNTREIETSLCSHAFRVLLEELFSIMSDTKISTERLFSLHEFAIEKNQAFVRDYERMMFFDIAMFLHPYWYKIKKKIHRYREGNFDVNVKKTAQQLSQSLGIEFPNDLITRAQRHPTARENKPESLALEHANRLLGLKEVSVDALYKHKREGKNLIKLLVTH